LGSLDAIFGPLRVGDSHWTLVYIDLRTEPALFCFLDPLGNEDKRIHSLKARWLRYVNTYNHKKLEARQLFQLCKNEYVIEKKPHSLQADNTTCGAWVMLVSLGHYNANCDASIA